MEGRGHEWMVGWMSGWVGWWAKRIPASQFSGQGGRGQSQLISAALFE